MNDNIPSPEKQKQLIYEEIATKTLKACYMIHKLWWEAWERYVNLDGEPCPGYISNTELVYFI